MFQETREDGFDRVTDLPVRVLARGRPLPHITDRHMMVPFPVRSPPSIRSRMRNTSASLVVLIDPENQTIGMTRRCADLRLLHDERVRRPTPIQQLEPFDPLARQREPTRPKSAPTRPLATSSRNRANLSGSHAHRPETPPSESSPPASPVSVPAGPAHIGVPSTLDASGPAGESTAANGPAPNTHAGGSLSNRACSGSGSLTAIRVVSCAKGSTNTGPLASGNPCRRTTRSSQASRASGAGSLSFFSKAMAPFLDRNLLQTAKERSHAFSAAWTDMIRPFQARPVGGIWKGSPSGISHGVCDTPEPGVDSATGRPGVAS